MANQRQIIYSCPRCGGTNLTYQIIDAGTIGLSTNKVVIQPAEKRHGCLYWLIFGWWWEPIKAIFKPKPRSGLNVSANTVRHQKVALCQTCGNSWNVK